jgi:hypothetical protein
MKLYAAFLVAMMVIAPSTLAQPPGGPPVGLDVLPQIVQVQKVDANANQVALVAQRTVYKTVAKTVPVEVIENGVKKIVNQTVNEAVPAIEYITFQWAADGKNALDLAGKPLAKEEVYKRLKPGIAVLQLPPGQKLSTVLQRLYHKDTVILVIGGK